jgi:hypothetical protein
VGALLQRELSHYHQHAVVQHQYHESRHHS